MADDTKAPAQPSLPGVETPPAPAPTYTQADVDRAKTIAATTEFTSKLAGVGLAPEQFERLSAEAKRHGWTRETWQEFLDDASRDGEDAAPADDAAPKAKTEEGKRYAAEALQLRRKLQEAEQRLNGIAAEREREVLSGELHAIAEKLGAADPEAVADHFLPRLKRFDGLTVVAGPKGEPTAASVEETVKAWLHANLARLKSEVRPGGGSRAPGGDTRAGAHQTPDEKTVLATREGQIEHLKRVGFDKILRGEMS